MGTCAGAILLARNGGGRPRPLDLLDAEIERNAYGTQLDSFVGTVRLDCDGVPSSKAGRTLEAPFIRAPRIRSVGRGVEVLARLDGDPVLVRAPGLLAATFHPELTRDPTVHALFLAQRPTKPTGAAPVPEARSGPARA